MHRFQIAPLWRAFSNGSVFGYSLPRCSVAVSEAKQLRFLQCTVHHLLIGLIYYEASSTLIRFQTKAELFCSVLKKICVYTYHFRSVFARPHYNAVRFLKTLFYPQCTWSNELDACAFQYIGPAKLARN